MDEQLKFMLKEPEEKVSDLKNAIQRCRLLADEIQNMKYKYIINSGDLNKIENELKLMLAEAVLELTPSPSKKEGAK